MEETCCLISSGYSKHQLIIVPFNFYFLNHENLKSLTSILYRINIYIEAVECTLTIINSRGSVGALFTFIAHSVFLQSTCQVRFVASGIEQIASSLAQAETASANP